jgi:hypothetical protein
MLDIDPPLGTGFMIDIEQYDESTNPGVNTKIALFRFFLEPLGVPVDKWSMSVRGRSRTYTFADVFSTYTNPIRCELEGSSPELPECELKGVLPAPHDCSTLIASSNTQFMSLPAVGATPSYAEVQKIFNRNCTECHGNLKSDGKIHGPYKGSLDLSEGVSYSNLVNLGFVTPHKPDDSLLFTIINFPRIDKRDSSMMPWGGPSLSRTHIETIKRWIEGGATNP